MTRAIKWQWCLLLLFNIPLALCIVLYDSDVPVPILLQCNVHHNCTPSIKRFDLRLKFKFVFDKSTTIILYVIILKLYRWSLDSQASWDKKFLKIERLVKMSYIRIWNRKLNELNELLFLLLYIKLGFMKQFVKVLTKKGQYFKYICSKFPVLSTLILKLPTHAVRINKQNLWNLFPQYRSHVKNILPTIFCI